MELYGERDSKTQDIEQKRYPKNILKRFGYRFPEAMKTLVNPTQPPCQAFVAANGGLTTYEISFCLLEV